MSDLSDVLRAFFAERPRQGLASVYLFGSHATGSPHHESDVDVAVLLDYQAYPTVRERFDERVRLASELIHALKCNAIDLVVLNELPPLFARRIVREGIKVFCADSPLDRNFLRDVQLKAPDVRRFLERTHRTKLAALTR